MILKVKFWKSKTFYLHCSSTVNKSSIVIKTWLSLDRFSYKLTFSDTKEHILSFWTFRLNFIVYKKYVLKKSLIKHIYFRT